MRKYATGHLNENRLAETGPGTTMIETTYKFHADGTLPSGDWIFVFGSNLRGAHGKGAAKVAHKNFRAEYGVGTGPTGQAYAIPTKDRQLNVLPLDVVQSGVAAFLEYAKARKQENFFVTAVGTRLAGYKDEEIGPLFAAAPQNCSLPAQWRPYVDELRARARRDALL